MLGRGLAGAAGTAAMLLSAGAPMATASTSWSGGSASLRQRPIAISLLREDSGLVRYTTVTSITCRKVNFPIVEIRGVGSVRDGVIHATGRNLVVKGLKIVTAVRAKIAGNAARGTLRGRPARTRGGPGGCRAIKPVRFVALDAAAPTGAPGRPAPNTLLFGTSGLSRNWARLGLMLGVDAAARRVAAVWTGTAQCVRFGGAEITNVTPWTRIGDRGRFSRPERYSIRYGDGVAEHYRVDFRGGFLADGASGTVRLRVRITRKGRLLDFCDSGTWSWWATAPPTPAPQPPPQQQPAPAPGETPPPPGWTMLED